VEKVMFEKHVWLAGIDGLINYLGFPLWEGKGQVCIVSLKYNPTGSKVETLKTIQISNSA